MEKLSAALSLPFTFIPAISTSHSIVPWIRERLLDDQIEADATPGGIRTFVPSANWNGTGAPWCAMRSVNLPPLYLALTTPADNRRAQALRVLEDKSITYEVQRTEDELSALHYPPVYRGAGEMWPRPSPYIVLHDHSCSPLTLPLVISSLVVSILAWHPFLCVTGGPTACWLSHLKAMKHAIDSGVQSVLILVGYILSLL